MIAGVADFYLFLVQKALIFRAVVVHVVRHSGPFKDDDDRACITHSSRLENCGILRVDQTSRDVFLCVLVGDVVNHAFRCVLERRRVHVIIA